MPPFYQSEGRLGTREVASRIDAGRKTIYTSGMRGLILIAATVAFLGACSSGGGCDGGDAKSSSGSGQSSGGGGGGGGGGAHGTSETVSFQGLGKNSPPPPANGQSRPASSTTTATNAAAAALGGSAANPSAGPAQSVICGGFPDMPADCLKDPAFDAIKKKCCPTGQVDQCQGIPGGARLIGHACTAAAK